MKEIFLAAFDGFCTIFWKVFVFLNKIAAFAIKIIGKLLQGIWLILAIIWPLSKIAPDINKFFMKLNSFLKPYLKQLSKRYEKFLEKADRSVVQKRIFVPILLILLFLFIYPPSHWGPWKLKEQGIASYYGYGFYFRRTASGEIYFPWNITAASLTLPLGTVAKVVNKNNGNVVYVRINDRGPYVNGRILDLSYAAAMKLGMYHHGIVPVDIYTKD